MTIKNFKSAKFVTKNVIQTSVSCYDDSKQCGYSFDVNKRVKDIDEFISLYVDQRKKFWNHCNMGTWSAESDVGYKNLIGVIKSGVYSFKTHEFKTFHKEHATGACCDQELMLCNFTNTCKTCGSDYNSSGQLLADRSLWGEETGEHWSECI